MAKRGRKPFVYDTKGFGQKVREELTIIQLTDIHLTDEKFAQRVGLHKATLSHVISGTQRISKEKQEAIINGLESEGKCLSLNIDRRELMILAGLATGSSVALPPSEAAKPQATEKYAEQLEQQQRWQEAEPIWSEVSSQAAECGDWNTWARCKLRVAQLEINLGRLLQACQTIRRVLSKGHLLDPVTRADAYFRWGWVDRDQDKLKAAQTHFMWALELLDRDRPCVDLPLLVGVYHLLGSVQGQLGVTLYYDEDELFPQASHNLEQAKTLLQGTSEFGTMGFIDFRLAAIAREQFKIEEARNLLDSGQEKLGRYGTAAGHCDLQKGLLLKADSKRDKARELIEKAVTGFASPLVFFPKGVGEAFHEMSLLLQDAEKTDFRSLTEALSYAFAAAIFHPHGENLSDLSSLAQRTYRYQNNSSEKFDACLKQLKMEARQKDAGPFMYLNRFVDAFGAEDGGLRFETGLETALKAAKRDISH